MIHKQPKQKATNLLPMEVNGSGSSESLSKVGTLELDLATIVHSAAMSSPRSKEDGVSMEMACKSGGSLEINVHEP